MYTTCLCYKISLSVVKWFVAAASLLCTVSTLVLVLMLATTQALAGIWLSAWSDDASVAEARNETVDRQLVYVRLGVYAGLGAAQRT